MRDEPDNRDAELDPAAAADPLIGSVAAELRRPVRLNPALDARVMAEILGAAARDAEPGQGPARVAAHPVRRGPWRWLIEPRTVRVSPLLGLAMAAGVAALMVLGVSERREVSRARLAAAAQAPGGVILTGGASRETPSYTSLQPYVHFVFVAPTAKSVSVVGDFNDWKLDATPLTAARDQRGVWTVAVPLPPGRYTYTFVVDGETWVADPSAPPALEDDFGTPKSVVTVGGGSHT